LMAGGDTDDDVSDLEPLPDYTPPYTPLGFTAGDDEIEPGNETIEAGLGEQAPIDIEADENAETEVDSVDSETRRAELVEMGLL